MKKYILALLTMLPLFAFILVSPPQLKADWSADMASPSLSWGILPAPSGSPSSITADSIQVVVQCDEAAHGASGCYTLTAQAKYYSAPGGTMGRDSGQFCVGPIGCPWPPTIDTTTLLQTDLHYFDFNPEPSYPYVLITISTTDGAGITVTWDLPGFYFYPLTTPPAAPTLNSPTSWGCTGSPQHPYVDLGWSSVSGATSYQVWRYPSGNPGAAAIIGNVSAPQTSFTDNTMANAQNYNYYLVAVNSAGSSPVSNQVSFGLECRPDLVPFGGISLNSGTLTAGNTVNFSSNAKDLPNTGCSLGSFNSRFEIDLNSSTFNPADTGNIVVLSPDPVTGSNLCAGGFVAAISGNWTAVAGTHTIRFCVDQPPKPDGNIVEVSETNNCTNSSGGVPPDITITVPPAASPPSCSFTGPTSLLVGQSGIFTYTGSGATTWSWTTSPSATPGAASPFASSTNWSSNSAGTFVVTLNVTGPGGSNACSNSLPNPPGGIVVNAPTPTPLPTTGCSFTGPTSLVIGQTGTFTYTSSGATSWSWTVSPSTTPGFTSPVASSTNWSSNFAGTYIITLNVSGPGGPATCDNSVSGGTVVNNPTPTPIPPPNCAFNYTGSVPLSVGEAATFSQVSTTNTTSWSWSSSPAGGTFTTPLASSSSWSASSPNTYVITLFVTGPGGSSTCNNSLPNPPGGTVVVTPTPTPAGPPLDVTCIPSKTQAIIGETIFWQAQGTGGVGGFTYTWTGTENLDLACSPPATCQTVAKAYGTLGVKTATCTVHSGALPPVSKPASLNITVVDSLPHIKTQDGDVHSNTKIQD